MEAPGTIARLAAKELGRAAFNRQFYLSSRPVVISDGASAWPAVHKWSPAHLRATLGRRPVYVKSNEAGVFDENEAATTGRVDISKRPFSEAVDLLLAARGRKYYIQQRSIAREFPELVPDLIKPLWMDAIKVHLVTNIWFGSAGCKTPLHYDRSHNFLGQVYGRKRIILFPPSCSRYLYAASDKRLPHVSRLNVFTPDVAAFPEFARAQRHGVDFTISPGDLLYIPQGWWHAVESLDVSISVNSWWIGLTAFGAWVARNLPTSSGRQKIYSMWRERQPLRAASTLSAPPSST